MSESASYLATSRPYVKRYGYQYRRHVFDKLRALDLVLAEFQQLLGHGEVIAEAEDGLRSCVRSCYSSSGRGLCMW